MIEGRQACRGSRRSSRTRCPGRSLTTHSRQGAAGYYALPLDTNTQALFWNKADFAAAGISGPPTTISAAVADASQADDTPQAQYGLGVDGTDIWNTAPYIWSLGGSFTNATYTKATGFMNSAGDAGGGHPARRACRRRATSAAISWAARAPSPASRASPRASTRCTSTGPGRCPRTPRRSPCRTTASRRSRPGPAGSFSTVGGEDIVIAAGGHHLAAAEKFAQFLDSSFAQDRDGEGGPHVGAETTTPRRRSRPRRTTRSSPQQLKTAKVRAVSAGLQPDGHRLVQRSAARSSPARCPFRTA